MPTLTELRALLDSTGKPICSSSGAKICTPCRAGCCKPPSCLRVTLDFRVPDVFGGPPIDIFICGPGDGTNPTDTYYPCYTAYPDMVYGGVVGRNVTVDTVVPLVGEAGPSPHVEFNYYAEWEVNSPSIYSPTDMAAFGAHPNSYFTGCPAAENFNVMRVSVHIYCEPDPGDPLTGMQTVEILYTLRRMSFSGPLATNEATAFIVARSKYNWGPPPICDPFSWFQYGEGDTEEGYNCSENGVGLFVPQASATASFDPYCFLPVGPEAGTSRTLAQTWPCFKDRPLTVVAWDCNAVIPPVGVGPAPPTPPPEPPPETIGCCADLFPFGSDPFLVISGTMVGVDPSGPGFDPGCGTCANGVVFFWFYHTPLGNGFLMTANVCGETLTVKIYCPVGDVSWLPTASMTRTGDTDVLIETALDVAPCTPGYPNTYFAIALTMNPGTNCSLGCPCYGGAYIIAG